MTFLKFGVGSLLALYLCLAVTSLFLGFTSKWLLTVGFVFLIFAFFASFYLHGLKTKNEWFCIPFLVTELILRLFIIIATIVLWMTFMLSMFDLIEIERPVDFVSGTTFLFLISTLSTFILTLLIAIYFPIYDGYRQIKKEQDRQKENGDCYMHLSFTSRPTAL
ncbi:hypothetical protein M3Y94_00834500 [Aphelenchoides besseyi]|nr:hypothetical protein M3Y94_00834500 [Aphelenchoides besseyi]KAI6226983.1 hypothetical protein M3Y95_00678800 [Aphelenchoides besseyi]